MANFDLLAHSHILLHQHYLKEGKREERTFLLQEDGQLSRIVWKRESDITGVTLFKLWTLHRGQLFSIYEGLAPRITGQMPVVNKPHCEDAYFEVYVYQAGHSIYQDPESGEPKPVYVSYAGNMFLRGLDVSELLLDHEEDESEPLFGKDFLEAYFDVWIPEGFEATALSEIHVALLSAGDKALFEEGEEFIKWLIKGEGLPKMSRDLCGFLQDNADVFARHINELTKVTTKEIALIRGAAFLRKLGENDAMFPYLMSLADHENSGLACLKLAEYFMEDGLLSDAFKYAIKGASMGIGQGAYLAARLCADRGLHDLTKMYLDMGMEAGDGDCFAFMAHEIMRFAKIEEENPFHYDKPQQTAMWFADQGVQRRSPKAMVFLSRLLLDFMSEEGADFALQLLLRAEALGEKEALYRLAIYYSNDHRGSDGKDLFLAETYVKKAIIENAYSYEECQMLYADILLEGGDVEKGMGFLEELARNGFEKAQVFLGKILAGTDPRYPYVEDPIPSTLIEALNDDKTFYKALLWRAYPEIVPPKKAASMLGKLAKAGEALAFRELAKIHRDGPAEIQDEKKAGYFEERFDKYRPK